jgi:triosephosphate isomerase
MNKIIVANWKMNPRTEREAVVLARASDIKNVVICPPFPFISAVRGAVRRATLGGQDAAPGTVGAETGEVSVGELKALGVQYVIIGHSERRAEGERDARIAKKIAGVLGGGLIPILCVGEPLSVRRKGVAAARSYVKKQLVEGLKLVDSHKSKVFSLYIAYEPVWAISTTKNHADETPEDAAGMAKFIRSLVIRRTSSVKILYGGSVNAKNAASFLRRPEFTGILVGGASIRPTEFKTIIRLASR